MATQTRSSVVTTDVRAGPRAESGSHNRSLGLDDGVRNGFSGLTVRFHLRGDDPDALRTVVDRSRARSAVLDVLTNAVPVRIDVDAG